MRVNLLLALACVAAVALAQSQPKAARVGLLLTGTENGTDMPFIEHFRNGMRERGYVEGRTLQLELRFANDDYARLPQLAKALVELKVDAIVTQSTPGVRAARDATASIPIVSGSFADPVGGGFAASFARPGGNITGVTNLGEEVNKKRLEILLALAPGAARVGYLMNPDNAATVRLARELQETVARTGRTLVPMQARDARDIEEAFARMAREKVGAVTVAADVFLNGQAARISALALKYRIASVFSSATGPQAGALASYAIDPEDRYQRVAALVDKILKGAKAGDLPIEQPSKFQLVINQKTAKALGLTIPADLRLRADKLVE